MANAPRDENQVTTLLGEDDTTGLPSPLLTDADGNLLVAATITDVPVADGGTGLTSLTPYAVITGGTTATGPMQQVSGVGTSGQVLTSNGASALPSWQSAGAAGANTALSNLASVAINTTLLPGSNDGAALGSGTFSFSDVFLASGGVINFSNGDVTLTHSSNLLTLAGGDLSLGANTLIAHSLKSDATDGVIVESANGTDVAIFGAANTANVLFYGAASFTGAALPVSDNTPALGASGQAWADLFLGDGSVINFNAGDVTITHSANTLTVAGGSLVGLGSTTATTYNKVTITTPASGSTLTIADGKTFTVNKTLTLDGTDSTVMTFPSSTDTVAGLAATQTLTNKRITKRSGTTTSSATPTINTDNVDFYSITAQSEAITSFTTNLSGTPTEAQTLWIAITDNGTARAITWGASFEASGTVALPTTTVISTRLDVGFVWNSVTSKWRCVATA